MAIKGSLLKQFERGVGKGIICSWGRGALKVSPTPKTLNFKILIVCSKREESMKFYAKMHLFSGEFNMIWSHAKHDVRTISGGI